MKGQVMPNYMADLVDEKGNKAFESQLIEDKENNAIQVYCSAYGYTWEEFLKENPHYEEKKQK